MAESDSVRPRIPLVEPLESRFGATTKDPKLVNAFAEKDESGDFAVQKRQGVAVFDTLAGAPAGPWDPMGQISFALPGAGLASFGYVTYFHAGIHVYATYEGSLGGTVTLDTGTSGLPTVVWQFSSVFDGDHIVTAIYPGTALVYRININAITRITIAYPGLLRSCPGLIFLDGTTYFMDTGGVIWGSGLNDTTNWDPLNRITASSVAGLGVALAGHQSFIVALKSYSIEFFYDAANQTGSPLLGVPNSTIQWGCVDGFTVQTIEDKIFWLATSKQSSFFVAVLDNRQPSVVSTPGVDRLLDGATGPFFSFSFKNQGHSFYGLTVIGSNLTLLYDIGQKLWYLWTDQNGNYWPWLGFTAVGTGDTICQNISSAFGNKIFTIDAEFISDSDSVTAHPIKVDVYTGNFDGGTRMNKVLQAIDIIADQQPGMLQARWSSDDFQSFSQFRTVDLNQERPRLVDCGTFRRRAYNFRYSAPYKFRLEAAELNVLLGTE